MMIFLETKSVGDIKLGDLIQLRRMKGLFAHWAVYVGDGDVIHLAPPPSKMELCSVIASSSGVTTISGEEIDMWLFGSIKVRRDKLTVVAKGSAIVVNNECDSDPGMTPFPGEIIVKRAESKLGTNDYNLLTWNCEHFATWCRYGKAVCKQLPFGQGLSNVAYLVKSPGIEVIPPWTLPDDIVVKAMAFSSRLRQDLKSLDEGQPIKFTADLNEGKVYSNHTGTFTAPLDGLYRLSFSVAHRNPGKPISVYLKINDIENVGATTDKAAPGLCSQASNHAVVKMMAGDTAQVVISNHEAEDIAAAGFTSFSGFLLQNN
ncbi:uncharacterized protein LOC128549514 [Mercenaria mercenaria]|uniref:uncharacterized protein LOC128549514 n=1 Tax=Mercenaria mercenaria TaxID=6596 RepID=UPI00234EE3B9|nr:uncharacterized protein LOC128549514 [Mercenaria mercenaria]